MKKLYLVAALALTAALGACASAGNVSIANASMESVQKKLTKGKTTQAEVRQIFGDPIKTSFTDSGNEAWEYEFTRMTPKATNFIPYVNLIHSGAEGDKKSLVIFFDRGGKVQKYTMSSSKVDISHGLITQ